VCVCVCVRVCPTRVCVCALRMCCACAVRLFGCACARVACVHMRESARNHLVVSGSCLSVAAKKIEANDSHTWAHARYINRCFAHGNDASADYRGAMMSFR
jgi:hypothetical protein